MPYLIRKATPADIQRLTELLNNYMQETYQTKWAGTAQSLEQHGFGSEFETTVAEDACRNVVAFVAITPTYDLHHCMKGGEVIDLFVCPENRGRGVALFLLTSVAKDVQGRGGTFLKGGAVVNSAVQRLYQRCGIYLGSGECYLSGRAFRRLAELSGNGMREMVIPI